MSIPTYEAPAGAVLLAAGTGSRLSPLTQRVHKSLLNIGGLPAIEHALNSILDAGVPDVVVVLGDKSEDVLTFLNSSFPGKVRTVLNPDFATDMNMKSVEIGVQSLVDSSLGYLIIETDLVLEKAGWKRILKIQERDKSFWVTKGQFSESLIGGCVKADSSGRVLDIAYSPVFRSDLLGWSKLLGILYVGSRNARKDQEFRIEALKRGLMCYYMNPWIENSQELESYVLDVSAYVGGTYNDFKTFMEIKSTFENRLSATQ